MSTHEIKLIDTCCCCSRYVCIIFNLQISGAYDNITRCYCSHDFSWKNIGAVASCREKNVRLLFRYIFIPEN